MIRGKKISCLIFYCMHVLISFSFEKLLLPVVTVTGIVMTILKLAKTSGNVVNRLFTTRYSNRAFGLMTMEGKKVFRASSSSANRLSSASLFFQELPLHQRFVLLLCLLKLLQDLLCVSIFPFSVYFECYL